MPPPCSGSAALDDERHNSSPIPPCMEGFDLDARPSAFGLCPLCRRGEAGSEHLGVWCPAVVAAWITSAAQAPSAPSFLAWAEPSQTLGLPPRSSIKPCSSPALSWGAPP
eukprot:4213869-Heterocapsa_arctica.AAC.1